MSGNGDFNPVNEVMSEINSSELMRVNLNNPNLASQIYKRLLKCINDFNDSLDHEYEVAVRLVSFGQTIVFHVTALGFYNPSLIYFYGSLEDGSPVQLIQHVSQISFLLMAAKRLDPEQPKRPIGFINTNTKE